jgi:hypothetical protein
MTEKTGRRLCGDVSFKLATEPLGTRICWCRDCQHLAGNVSVNIMVAADGLTVTGKLADHTKSANSGKVTGREPWANLHLLFWLSLFPFATGWMGENHLAPWPRAA